MVAKKLRREEEQEECLPKELVARVDVAGEFMASHL